MICDEASVNRGTSENLYETKKKKKENLYETIYPFIYVFLDQFVDLKDPIRSTKIGLVYGPIFVKFNCIVNFTCIYLKAATD